MTTHLWFSVFLVAMTTLSILLLICRRQYTQHVTDLRALWTKSATEARGLRIENQDLRGLLRQPRAALEFCQRDDHQD